MDDDSFDLPALIAAGFILALGLGVYLVLKSFGAFSAGDEITINQIHKDNETTTDQIPKDDDDDTLTCEWCHNSYHKDEGYDERFCSWDCYDAWDLPSWSSD